MVVAEAERLRLPVDRIVVSDEISENAEGLDALLADVPDIARDSG